MTVVNPKSISGINSITTGSGSDDILTIHTNNGTERLRVDSTGATKIVTGIVTTLTATTGIVTTLTANTVTSLGAVSGTTGTFSGAVSGTTGTFTGDLTIPDKIVHTGDTDTSIRLGVDTVTVETAGSERTRITSGGSFLVGKTSGSMTTAGTRIDPQSTLITGSSTSTNLATASGAALNLINNSATDNNFSNIGGYNSNGLVISQINFINKSHSSRTGDIAFMTHDGSSMPERLRIASDGKIGINQSSPQKLLDVYNSSTNESNIYVRNASVNYIVRTLSDQVQAGSETNHPFYAISNNQYVARFDGDGIKFGSDTAAANALDDYEEGTWTPVPSKYNGGAISATYTNQTGYYVRIGKLVHVEFRLHIGAVSQGSSLPLIDGLPFLPDSNRSYHASGSIGFNTALTNDYIRSCFVHPDYGGCIYFIEDTRDANISTSAWQGGQMFGSIVYIAT